MAVEVLSAATDRPLLAALERLNAYRELQPARH